MEARIATASATLTKLGLWRDYLSPDKGAYIYDDNGRESQPVRERAFCTCW